MNLTCPFCKSPCSLKVGAVRGFGRVGIVCESPTGIEHYAFIMKSKVAALELHKAITEAAKDDCIQTISIGATQDNTKVIWV